MRVNCASCCFSSVLCDPLWPFVPPWTAARQASFTISCSLLKLMSSESVIPSNHLILCHPLLLLPTVFPTIRVFSSELALCIRWLKYWSFSFSISPSYEYSGMISFRIDWFDLLVVQGPLKSLLLHHSSNTWILLSLTFVMVQLSNPYMTTVHVHLYIHTWLHILLTLQTFVDKVMSLIANMLSRFITAFSFFSKEQESFSLMAAVTVHSDFGAQENKVSLCLHFFPPSICHEVMGSDAMILFFECWLSLSSLTSSRGSLRPLSFLPLQCCHLHIWDYWYFSWQSWFQL